MSVFQTDTLSCPSCGEDVDFDVVYSVNAASRADLRDAILDGTFQQGVCSKCEHTFRLEPELSYFDAPRKQWFLVRPVSDLAEWSEMEEYARTFFDAAFGEKAPGPSRAIGRGMTVRVTFGWADLREKLLLRERDLDDVTFELLKLAIIRGVGDPPLSNDSELRFFDLQDDELTLAWINGATEKPLEIMNMPRSRYDEIESDQEAWQPLREQLSAGPFVDYRRLYLVAT